MPVKTVFQDSEGGGWHVSHGFVTYQTEEVLPLSDIPEFIEWLQSEYAKHKPEAKTDDDGWIQWEGGECPAGIERRYVDVKWRAGGVTLGCYAQGVCWSHRDMGWDVIAYRLSK